MANNKKENIDEISAMSGGAVEGSPSSDKDNKKKSSTIFQEEDEEEFRKIVQELLKKAINKRILSENRQLKEEKKLKSLIKPLVIKAVFNKINEEKELKSFIRILLKEAKKDVEKSPHSSTAINLLEDLLKQILPNLESEYKTLTTAKEQRDSFRAHIVNAVSTLLETEDVNKEGGAGAEEEKLIGLDEQEDEIEEEIELKVSDVGAPADDKFIDIEGEEPIPEEEEDTFGLEGQDATGRALAKQAFDNIEKNIVETYAILHDSEDEKLFQDYLITNLKLYLDKWEKELGAVTEPTTDEYETEKEEGEPGAEAGAEFDAELGGELGGETPAPAGGEELIQ